MCVGDTLQNFCVLKPHEKNNSTKHAFFVSFSFNASFTLYIHTYIYMYALALLLVKYTVYFL